MSLIFLDSEDELRMKILDSQGEVIINLRDLGKLKENTRDNNRDYDSGNYNDKNYNEDYDSDSDDMNIHSIVENLHNTNKRGTEILFFVLHFWVFFILLISVRINYCSFFCHKSSKFNESLEFQNRLDFHLLNNVFLRCDKYIMFFPDIYFLLLVAALLVILTLAIIVTCLKCRSKGYTYSKKKV